jgi:uncharacterized membrane protein
MTSEADLKMEISISRMLRTGVSLAAGVVLIGAVLYLLQAPGAAPDFQHFHGVPSPAGRITPILDGIRQRDSRSIIQLGILVLIATPIMRVGYCVFGFAAQKDKVYIVVSSVVLVVLLYSFFRP